MNKSPLFFTSAFVLFFLITPYWLNASPLPAFMTDQDSLANEKLSEIADEYTPENSNSDQNSTEIAPSSHIDNLDFFEDESTIEEFTQHLINLIVGMLENPYLTDKDALNAHVIEQLTQLFTTYNALITISIDVEKRTALPEENMVNPKVQIAFDHLTKMFIGAANIAANKHDPTNIITNIASMVENLAHIIVLAKRSGTLRHEATRAGTHNTMSVSLAL